MKCKLMLLVGATAMALSLTACGDDDENGDANGNGNGNGNGNNNLTGCAAVMAEKTERLSNEIAAQSVEDATEMVRTGGDQNTEADYAGRYRDDLANHPGCLPRAAYGANTSEPFSSDNEATVPSGSPANIPGYDCAAKEYDQPSEDTSLPIVILVHGNSSGVTSFEEYALSSIAGTSISTSGGFDFTVDSTTREQLATKLIGEGFRVIGFDARVDLVATLSDYSPDASTGNPFLNIDHGWAVPMLQSLIKAVITNNPTRQVSLVGHSLGVTVIRDALRRLYIESRDDVAGAVNPFESVKDVVLLSGANHGVSTGAVFCSTFTGIMRGTITCEMGDRDAFVRTYFSGPLNGPEDVFSTPCADGDFAFGDTDACAGNTVEYTTVTMEDLPDGSFQDEFVSEDSSSLRNGECVDNEFVSLNDFDSSGYFFTGANGFLANHFGAARSNAGIDLVVAKLTD